MTKMEKLEKAIKTLSSPTMELVDKLNSDMPLSPTEANLLLLHLQLIDGLRDEMDMSKSTPGYSRDIV